MSYFATTGWKEFLPVVPSYSPMLVRNLSTSCNPGRKQQQPRPLGDHPINKTVGNSFLSLRQH